LSVAIKVARREARDLVFVMAPEIPSESGVDIFTGMP